MKRGLEASMISIIIGFVLMEITDFVASTNELNFAGDIFIYI